MEGVESSTNIASTAAKKLRRITRACDYCHKRSIRCRFPEEPSTTSNQRCQNCIDFDQPCRFDRAVKRRGAKPRSQKFSSPEASPTIKSEPIFQDFCRTPSIPVASSPPEWKAPHVAPQDVVVQLVEVYLEVIYPHYPWFHRRKLRDDVRKGEYLTTKFGFAAIMAMCALSASRVASRAISNPKWDAHNLTLVKAEAFYAAAVRECGNAGSHAQIDFDLLRTCALLSLTAIQFSRYREFLTHLGKYHTLVGMDAFQDEEKWPKNIGIIETEMRRRLFWSMYCLDVYSSVVWNGVMRCREQQSHVSYTTELDDEFFDDDGYRPAVSEISDSSKGSSLNSSFVTHDIRTPSWLCGWNFITDLHRMTEHILVNFRDKSRQKQSFLNDIFGANPAVSASSVRDSVTTIYNKLPPCFKEVQLITYDGEYDRYGFQVANIIASVQLLRMILFSSAGASVEEMCRVVSEVVEAFMRIPVEYLQALSSPLLHHLGGIGSILGSVLDEVIPESSYHQVRVVLLALAQLLDNLNHGLRPVVPADKLRSLVARADQRVQTQRQGRSIDRTQGMRDTSSFIFKQDGIGETSRQSTFSHSNSQSAGPSGTTQQLPFAMSNDLFDHWPWGAEHAQFPSG